MNKFWLKIAGLAVLVVAFAVLLDWLSKPKFMPEPAPKTYYDVIREDDKRLRADVEEPSQEEKPQSSEQAATVTEQAVTVTGQQAVEKTVQQPRAEIPIEDQVQAERLFEMALAQRKMGRLPGMSYKKMVDYCREIIQKYPSSPQAPKARRMLADIPKHHRKLYNITDEEINPAK